MANDTTIKSIFDHAKKVVISGDIPEANAAVRATWVGHYPNNHPDASGSADLVTYANGRMVLSADEKTLSGEFKLWKNVVKPAGSAGGSDDLFASYDTKASVAISLSDSGQVMFQRKSNGTPIGNQPPQPLKASFQNAMFVETSAVGVQSLSFTLQDEL